MEHLWFVPGTRLHLLFVPGTTVLLLRAAILLPKYQTRLGYRHWNYLYLPMFELETICIYQCLNFGSCELDFSFSSVAYWLSTVTVVKLSFCLIKVRIRALIPDLPTFVWRSLVSFSDLCSISFHYVKFHLSQPPTFTIGNWKEPNDLKHKYNASVEYVQHWKGHALFFDLWSVPESYSRDQHYLQIASRDQPCMGESRNQTTNQAS